MADRSLWAFSTAGELLFGAGCLIELGHRCVRNGWERPHLITDRNLLNAGHVDSVTNALSEVGLYPTLFSSSEREPAIETACKAAEFAREWDPDVIIGLGGGSNLDLAKIVSILLKHGGEPADYFGALNVPGPVLPLIAIPTTSGTGSEVSHSAVLTDAAAEMKVSTLSPYLRPSLAIVDPELTLSCPRKATADAGIDALVHAIEAYLSTASDDMSLAIGEPAPYSGQHPLGDVLAEKAIRLVGEHLENAVENGDDIKARSGMSLAATLAGMAFSNCGVSLVHALEYPLGGALHVSHGEGNGLLLPYVMEFVKPVRTERIARIGHFLGANVDGLPMTEAADVTIQYISDLRSRIGIRTRIRELGGSRDQLPGFARLSFEVKRLIKLTARQPSEADCLAVLESAW